MKDKVLSLLGLARRANRLIFGEVILEKIRNVRFMFIANDASIKTKERYLKKCNYYRIPYADSYSSDELALAVGRNNVKTIGITDEGFARGLIKEIERGCNYGETDKEKTEQH